MVEAESLSRLQPMHNGRSSVVAECPTLEREFRALLGSGADPCAALGSGDTLLRLVAAAGHAQLATLLLSTQVVYTLLLSTLAAALEAAGCVDVRNRDSKSALHLAKRAGCVPIVEALCRCKADVHAMEPLRGRTPLHEALARGAALGAHLTSDDAKVGVVAALLRAGASTGARDRVADTAVAYAVDGSNRVTLAALLAPDLDLFENASMLLAAGADVNSADELGNRPLHLLCGCGEIYALPERLTGVQTTRLLLNANADPWARNAAGQTALHAAAAAGREDSSHHRRPSATACVEQLLGAGFSPEDTDARGCAPLHLCRCPGAAGMLMRARASARALCTAGAAPLHWAAGAGLMGIVVVLLLAGAAPYRPCAALGLLPDQHAVLQNLNRPRARCSRAWVGGLVLPYDKTGLYWLLQ
ncbi:hypothetical protein WJX81_004269 [Elliptochloris bilobata]|uniref:Uncharacterized protein n=1 Tax=Elliptochloris bilobata TaxID=381761 RepID=A0AAW1RGH4_9CHLO